MSIEFAFLADCVDAVPIISRWYFDEWGHLEPDHSIERAHDRFAESITLLDNMSERSLLPDVLFSQVYALRALGKRRQALEMMAHALRMVLASGPLNPMRFELPAVALLSADAGDAERAVEFYAAALQSPYIRNSTWFEQFAGEYIAALAAELPEETAVAAQERGRQRDLWTTAEEILAELEEGRMV